MRVTDFIFPFLNNKILTVGDPKMALQVQSIMLLKRKLLLILQLHEIVQNILI